MEIGARKVDHRAAENVRVLCVLFPPVRSFHPQGRGAALC